MNDIQRQLGTLSPEELQQFLEECETRFDLAHLPALDEGALRDLFRYMEACIMTGDDPQAFAIFGALRGAVDDFLYRGENPIAGFDFLSEWAIVALNLQQDKNDRFASIQLYKDLMAAAEAAGEEGVNWRRARVALQAANHYRQWLEEGGRPDALSTEDAAWMVHLSTHAQEEAEKALEELIIAENWEKVVSLKRVLARSYLNARQPNEALALMKSLLEDLPLTPHFHPADLADQNVELGKVFLRFKKNEVAKRYFQAAMDQYEALGEDFEPFLWQAEGLLETC